MRTASKFIALGLLVASIVPATAGDWHPRGERHHPRPSEAILVTEQYERTELHVRFEEPEHDDAVTCIPYKHAIWIHQIAIVDDRLACQWPDGTWRNGPRPY